MLGKNRRLVTYAPVEFEKWPAVEVGNFKRITDHFRGIYERNIPHMNKAAKPEDRCQHVTGWIFRFTRILTDYAQKLSGQRSLQLGNVSSLLLAIADP